MNNEHNGCSTREGIQMTFRLFMSVTFVLVLCVSLTLMMACSEENGESQTTEKGSSRSAPPDTTPYIRKAVPEDYAPGGKEAIPPEVITEPQTREPIPLEKSQPPDKRDKSE